MELGAVFVVVLLCLGAAQGLFYGFILYKKDMMADPAYSQYTLLSLAFDAGFNSKSSFNRAVAKLEGVTPSELKANL